MSIQLEITYANKLKLYVEKFKRKSDYLWNFRCPICGDSAADTRKKRGFIVRWHNTLFYKCHNCGVSVSFIRFLRDYYPDLYRGFCTESIRGLRNGEVRSPDVPEYEGDISSKMQTLRARTECAKQEIQTGKESKSIDVESLKELPDGHYAKEYAKNRKIPDLSKLYFVADFYSWVDRYTQKYPDLKKDEPRIVIPFFDKEKRLIGAQARSLTADKLRYITVRFIDDAQMIYGLDYFDPAVNGYIVEGPIDSMFLPNAIAAAGSSLDRLSNFVDVSNSIFVFDNEKRNKEIHHVMHKVISHGHKICIWPDSAQFKDINDAVLAGVDPKKIVDENAYSGLSAELKFVAWKL